MVQPPQIWSSCHLCGGATRSAPPTLTPCGTRHAHAPPVIASACPLAPSRECHLLLQLSCFTRRNSSLRASDAGGSRNKLVAGGRFELYSAYSIRVPAVPASVFATR